MRKNRDIQTFQFPSSIYSSSLRHTSNPRPDANFLFSPNILHNRRFDGVTTDFQDQIPLFDGTETLATAVSDFEHSLCFVPSADNCQDDVDQLLERYNR